MMKQIISFFKNLIYIKKIARCEELHITIYAIRLFGFNFQLFLKNQKIIKIT